MPDDNKGAQGGQPPAQNGKPADDKGAPAPESKGGAQPGVKKVVRNPVQHVQVMTPEAVELAMKKQFAVEIMQKMNPVVERVNTYLKMQEEAYKDQKELVVQQKEAISQQKAAALYQKELALQQQANFKKAARWLKGFGIIAILALLVIIGQGIYVTRTVSKFITNNTVVATLNQNMKEFASAVKTLKQAAVESKKMAESFSKLEGYYNNAKLAIERNQEARLEIEKSRRATMSSYSSQAVTSARPPAEDTRGKTVRIENVNSNGKEIQVYGLLGGTKKFVVSIPAGFSSTVSYDGHYGMRFQAKIKGEELESTSPEFSEGPWRWEVDGASREGKATKL